MKRFTIRTLFAFTAVYAVYVLLLISVRPITSEGGRLLIIPNLSLVAEALLLLPLVAVGFAVARYVIFMDLDDDWRRGVLQICLAMFAVAVLAAPLIMRCLMLLADAMLSHMLSDP